VGTGLHGFGGPRLRLGDLALFFAMAAPGTNIAPDLRKRIEIMAEHIARNGSDFENTVKVKNVNNVQFAFLYGGEGSDYYQHVLDSHRSQYGGGSNGDSWPSGQGGAADSMQAQGQGAAGSVQVQGSMQAMMQAQAHGNVCSLQAMMQATGPAVSGLRAPPLQQQQLVAPTMPQQQQQQPAAADGGDDLAQLVQKWKEPPVYALMAEAERQLGEIATNLEQMASRDAIRNGRAWIEANAAIAQQIAGNIMKRIGFLKTCGHRLHILYLVHDVLQTEAARKDSQKPLIRGFRPYLVWILRPCFQLAKNAGTAEGDKVLRLLQLWVERAILTTRESEELRLIITAPDLPGVAVQPPQQQQQRPVMRPPAMMAPGMMAPGRPVGVPPQMGVQNRPQMMQQAAWPKGQMVMPGQQPGMPGQPSFGRPMLAGYRPQMMQVSSGKQTPETVPVGVMATMLRQAMRRVRESRQEFIPYKPMETQFTPQVLPPMEVPTPRLMERVQDFYEDLRDEARGSSSSRSSSRSRSRSSRSRSSHSRRSRSRGRGERPQGFSHPQGFVPQGFSHPQGFAGVAVPPPVLN
jgi:hypothetical protein